MIDHDTPARAEYLTCAETAKLLRGALKRQFPGVKFSVRSHTYSGGASIDVRWTDGPTSAAVDAVCNPYKGADFDGMVDLKTYSQHWLQPDGSAAVAYAGAQGSTRPEVIGDPPGPAARLVHFGADFIFAERDVSPEWRAAIVEHFEQVIGRPLPRDDREWYRVMVPLSVDRTTGELYHMVEHEQTELSQVFRAFTSSREGGQL